MLIFDMRLYLLVFVVLFSFCDINSLELTHNVLNVCTVNTPHLFVPKDSSLTLSLILHSTESLPNCSIEIFSNTPQLKFHFNSLNLPIDFKTHKCLIFVTIADHSIYSKGNFTESFCEVSDFPKEGIIIESPAIVSMTYMCLSKECHLSSSDYNFELTIFPIPKDCPEVYLFLSGVGLSSLVLIGGWAIWTFIIMKIYRFVRRKSSPQIIQAAQLPVFPEESSESENLTLLDDEKVAKPEDPLAIPGPSTARTEGSVDLPDNSSSDNSESIKPISSLSSSLDRGKEKMQNELYSKFEPNPEKHATL